ncbi:MAG: arylsulfatase [Oscillospiraceae bacterium]|nr:arylsulfatase [Oscillospiraceae bacterium]MDD4368771.1 arylsulfatase [Oscillospiraceae bacterium]
MDKPNIVLIMADQMRGDCLSHLQHPVVETPWLDHLARDGVSFTRAYSAVPSCIPARAALMTGLSQDRHGRLGYQDRVTWNYSQTLPGVLRAHGYQTHCVGKMHVWPARNRLGYDEVELHDGYLHTERNPGIPISEHSERNDDYLTWLHRELPDADLNDSGLECNSWMARPFPYDEAYHPTNWVTRQAAAFLKRRDPTAPFFLTLSYVRPHAPLDPPRYYFDLYDRQEFDGPLHADWEQPDQPRLAQYVNTSKGKVPPLALHRALAAYYGSISHIDNQIGRFYMSLQDAGELNHTVILFVSDHGDMLGDFNLLRKSLPYEGSAHVPLILSDPGNLLNLPQGSQNQTVAELRDVMPTLLNAAGILVPAGLDGVSLLPASRGEINSLRPYLHGEHTLGVLSNQWILEGSLKYIWFSQAGREQLFDLARDPRELADLAEDAGYAGELTRLRGYLIDTLARRGDGYSDGHRLLAGTAPHNLLPSMTRQ